MSGLHESQDAAKYQIGMQALLEISVERSASDLHLVTGAPPIIRVDGEMEPVSDELPKLMPTQTENLLKELIDDFQFEQLQKTRELDFSYAVPGLARFRGNVIYQRGTLAIVFRVVPFKAPKLKDLKLPPDVERLCGLNKGLVLVTGPTGSGKSTTLAAIINYINETCAHNIVTVEDPIEFLHQHKKSTVRQREIGMDTLSFSNALRQVLRHDPDVIMIGEMRDLESISIAVTAAETGHLVFSTLHTQTAPLTISRIVDAFPETQKLQVRQQLANSLRAVISQQLIPLRNGSGRIAAVEYMIDTPAVRSLVREGKEYQLYSAIQTGSQYGMQTMDQALVSLIQKGAISLESAHEFCVDRSEFDRLVKSIV